MRGITGNLHHTDFGRDFLHPPETGTTLDCMSQNEFDSRPQPAAHALMAPQRCLRARPIHGHAYESPEAAACGRRMDGECLLQPERVVPLLMQ